MPSYYKPDHRSFGEFILSEQARKPAVQAARAVAEVARATAPRSSRTDKEHFGDHFGVTETSAPVVVGGNPRVGAEVFNDVEHAAAVEFGNQGRPAHRTLRRAGARIGELRGEPG